MYLTLQKISDMKNQFYNSPTEYHYQGKKHGGGCFAPAVLLICLIAVAVFGCGEDKREIEQQYIPIRPLVIHGLHTYASDAGTLITSYSYYDANGRVVDRWGLPLQFTDLPNKYSIGDTIR